MPKRLLTRQEKAETAERLKAAAMARHPDAEVSAHVEDETDDEGNPIAAAIVTRYPKPRKPH